MLGWVPLQNNLIFMRCGRIWEQCHQAIELKPLFFVQFFSQFWNQCGFKHCNCLVWVFSMPLLRSLREFQFYMYIHVVSHCLQQHWESEKIQQTHTDRFTHPVNNSQACCCCEFCPVCSPSKPFKVISVCSRKKITFNQSFTSLVKKTNKLTNKQTNKTSVNQK